MLKKILLLLGIVILAGGLLCLLGYSESGSLEGEEVTVESKGAFQDTKDIWLIKGELETIKTNSLTRVSITNPDITDVTRTASDHVLLLAKQAGQTTLFIWDAAGKKMYNIYVTDENLARAKSRLGQLLNEAGLGGISLEINDKEGKLMLLGKVPTAKKEIFKKLTDPFTANIIDLTEEKTQEDLVQIDAQILELNSSYAKNMGIEWTSALSWKETLPTFNVNAPTDFLKIGNFLRADPITAKINALITEGKGRILSRPKLVCASGKEARFLVGGEIPISTTTTSSGGTVQENVQFRPYGVNLTVTPTIKDTKVNILLNIYVTDIDASNKVGNNVAFTTRTAQTELYLEDGQTVILAGLIKNSQNQTIKRIPIFSDIPILGAVFRTRLNSPANTETELVITLKPTILTSENMNPASGQMSPVAKVDLGRSAEELKSTGSQKALTTLSPGQRASSQASMPSAAQPAQGQTAQKSTAEQQETTDVSATSEAKISSASEPAASEFNKVIPATVGNYVRTIQESIARKIMYPQEAREKGWMGTVKLSLRILEDGTLAFATIKESSGYEVFDEDALSTAKSLAPYSAFPSELTVRELTITLPIVYSLKDTNSN